MSESTSKQSKKKKKITSKKKASSKVSSKVVSSDANTNEEVQPSQTKQPLSQTAALESNQTSEIGKPAVQTVEKKSGSGLSVVAILLSLVAIGVTGYTWYKIDVLDAQSNTKLAVGMQDIAGQVTRISDSVSVLQSSHSNSVSKEQLTTRLLETQVSVDKQFEKLQSGQQGLSESILKISTDLQKGANEYVVDEVSQLLKLANNNVIFSNNIEAAINAFSLADTQLKELASPRFSEVRRKINDEIELLRAVELVDIESTLAKLNAISANIESLPLENEPPVIEEDAQSSSEGVTEEITWRTELRKMWGDIIGSFNIQRVGKAPKPLLAPSERYFLDQNLKLALSKAEIALLQDRQALYISSVSEANDWLNEYFDLNDDRVKDAVSQLNKLKTVEFSQELPSVAGSYELLQSIKGGQ